MAATSLGEVCDILSGFAWSASKFNHEAHGIPIIRIQNVDAIQNNDFVYWEEPYDERFVIRRGDILLTLSGSFRIESWNGPNALLNQRIIKLTPSEKLDRGWLLHVLRPRLGHIERLGKHALVNNVSIGDIRKLQIPVPSLPEQRRIAEILDKADALRAKRRAALAKLDKLTQSIFLDMFGDPATNPKGWPLLTLNGVFDIARGGSPRPIDDYLTEDKDGINWIMIGDASEATKYITRTKKRIRPEGAQQSRTVKPGDFLLTNSMSFGRPYIMKCSGCIHDGWLVLSPRHVDFDSDYFYSLLGSAAMSTEFSRRAPGATVKNLNIDLVRGVAVPVPPLERQRQFAENVASIERSSESFKHSLAEFDALFASLQHRAFRGEL